MLFGKYRNTLNGPPRGPALVSNEINDPQSLELHTSLLHKFDDDPMSTRLQISELDYLTASAAGRTVFAENYVGLPFEKFE